MSFSVFPVSKSLYAPEAVLRHHLRRHYVYSIGDPPDTDFVFFSADARNKCCINVC